MSVISKNMGLVKKVLAALTILGVAGLTIYPIVKREEVTAEREYRQSFKSDFEKKVYELRLLNQALDANDEVGYERAFEAVNRQIGDTLAGKTKDEKRERLIHFRDATEDYISKHRKDNSLN